MKKTISIADTLYDQLAEIKSKAIAEITYRLRDVGEIGISYALTLEPTTMTVDIFYNAQQDKTFVTIDRSRGNPETVEIESELFTVDELVNFLSDLENEY
jgi:hypothetical protein